MPTFSTSRTRMRRSGSRGAADSRVAKTAGANPAGVFTSDLSVSEYVLLGEAGFEPLGFVVGSSIYHIGVQVGRWNQNTELLVLTQAMYNASELAMAGCGPRPTTSAPTASSACTCGCRCTSGARVLEFVATGTAVRHLAGQGAHRAPDGGAFTSDLSAQDFFRLLAAAPCRSPSCSEPASTTLRTRA